MSKDSFSLLTNEFYENKFIEELYDRTSLLNFKAENSNYLVVVDLRDCKKSFINKAEYYYKNNKKFKIRIIGPEYYLEVLNCGTYFDAYYN